jgi:nucleotide-binding universal stress UspA family protein
MKPTAPSSHLRVRKVLFPTDFSPCARQAFAHATSFAGRFGADLHLLHALPPPWQGFYDPMLFVPPSETAYDEARATVAAHLAELAADPLTAGLHVVTAQCEDYPPAAGILDYAQRQGIDLIVLGTHGRRGPARLLLGSVAEEVARHSHCPVLAVRERQDDEGTAHLLPRQVLVPFDFSAPSRRALADAAEVARRYDAHLLLLHVVEERTAAEELAGKAARAELADIEQIVATRRLGLHDVLDAMAPGVTGAVEVRVGRPATEILSVAARPDVDLMVMATLGLTGVRRLLFGSTAEEVLRLAVPPVLLIKAPVTPEKEAATESEEQVPAGAGAASR